MPLTAEVTPLEENRVRLDVAVPGDEVQRRMERAIRQLGRDVRVPGFRPGKAPAEVIVQRVGRDAVVQEMLQGLAGRVVLGGRAGDRRRADRRPGARSGRACPTRAT